MINALVNKNSSMVENNKISPFNIENYNENLSISAKNNTIMQKNMIKNNEFRINKENTVHLEINHVKISLRGARKAKELKNMKQRKDEYLIEASKSPDRPPQFNNKSINSNPYLSQKPNSRQTSILRTINMSKNTEISNNNYTHKNRNLSILSRNLRNLTFLKSPNPVHGSKSKDIMFNLKTLDSSYNNYP